MIRKGEKKNSEARKVARKRVATKKILTVAPSAQAFWVHGGPVLRSLVDLKNFLSTVTLDQFFYHTKRGNNDFAKWVREILRDEGAALGLEAARTPREASSAVTRALRAYKI